DFFQHSLIRRADFVIHFDETPAHFASAINHISGRMWQRAAGLIIEQAIAINHAMIGVGEHWEIDAGLVFELLAQEMSFVVWVNANGENGDFVTIGFIK